jgi:hypothetical protein
MTPLDNQEIIKSRILSCYSNTDDIIKAGEGSRGGKVIGHDKNGNPIYEKGVTKVEKRHQVVAIYPDSYKVLFNSRNREEATAHAAKVRSEHKKKGGKVITNQSAYKSDAPEGEGDHSYSSN